MNTPISHSIQRIGKTPLKTDPFPHLFIEQIFPDEFYQEILESLPDPSYYLPSQSNVQTWGFSLDDDNIDRLPFGHMLFWKRFCHLLCSDAWMIAVLEKFQPHLKGSFQESIEKKHLYPIVQIDQSKPGYSIGPHTDHPAKVATFLFYLPSSQAQGHLGTALYRPKKGGFTCRGLHRYPFEDFEKVGKAPFIANAAFGFLKTEDSFHGVEVVGPGEKERNLISYTIWKNVLNQGSQT